MLAVIETHPVQYHAPVYRALSERFGVSVTAIYGSNFSVAGYRDADFGATFSWDTDLLSGYSSVFLSTVEAGGPQRDDLVPAAGIKSALRRLKPTAALILGYSPRFHRVAWYEAWRAGCRILFRGETNDEAQSRSWIKARARGAALALAYQSCARLLYIGERSREHFLRVGVSADRLAFSPYAVDTTTFEIDEEARTRLRASTRHALDLGSDDILLLFSGKLTERKGVDLIVEGVKRLPAEIRSRVAIGFLGDGALKPQLEAQAGLSPAVRVRFIGFQNQRSLSPYYHAADVLVLPSRRSETWGLVVNEALHHGVPCLVSDRVGCAPDLVRPGSTGEIFASGEPEDLARGIVRALAWCGNAATRHACRQRVSDYSIDRAAAGIADAYHAVVAPRESAA